MDARHLRAAATLATAAWLAGCATDPPAAPALAVGTASLDAARAAGAPELASAELNEARTKLEAARAAAQAGRNVEALRLAEQADVDAQLARARAGSERSRRALAEVEAGLATLREELNRGAVTQPVRTPQ